MAKKKKKSRVIRVDLSDYLVIAELSRKFDKTMAEALHILITDRVSHTVAYRTTPITAIATNGSKGIAVGIKPKGVKYV